MRNSLPQISEWNRIFVDTSFIIDAVRDLSFIKETDSKITAIKRTHALLEYFELSGQEIK